MTPRPTPLQTALRARVAALMLDHQLATGLDPAGDPALRRRAVILSSRRARRRVAAGLQRVLKESQHQPGISAAVTFDREAVELARPALEQLERAVRERSAVQPQGLAMVQLLLTDPEGALYRPTRPERLYDAARTALLTMRADDSAPAAEEPQILPPLARVG